MLTAATLLGCDTSGHPLVAEQDQQRMGQAVDEVVELVERAGYRPPNTSVGMAQGAERAEVRHAGQTCGSSAAPP